MRLAYFILLNLLISVTVYAQVSLKYLKEDVSHATKEMAQLLENGENDKSEKLYGEESEKFNLFLNNRSNYSLEEQKKYAADFLTVSYNYLVNIVQDFGILQGDSLKQVQETINYAIDQYLSFTQTMFGENHLLSAYSFSMAAYFYHQTGDLDVAETYHLEAIRIYEEQPGKDHILYFDEVARLAHLYLKKKEPEKANFLLSEIEPSLNIHYPKNHLDYVEILSDIIGTNFELLQFTQAIDYIEHIIEAYGTLQNQEIFKPVIKLYTETKSFLQANIGSVDKLSLNDLNGFFSTDNSAFVYEWMNYYERITGGVNDLDISQLVRMADVQFMNFQIEVSDSLYNKALQWEIRKNGTDSPLSNEIIEAIKANSSMEGIRGRMKKLLSETEINIGIYSDEALQLSCGLVNAYMDDAEQVDFYSIKTLQILTEQVKRKINFLSEAERETWWSFYSLKQLIIKYLNVSLIGGYDETQLTANVYNSELLSKGFLLNSSQSIKQSILLSGDSELINKWSELEELKKTEKPIKNEQIEQLERYLNVHSQSYREQQTSFDIQWEQVQQALSPGEIAIEFLEIITPDNGLTSSYYFALLVNPDCSYPAFVMIGSDDVINQAIDDSRNEDNQTLYRVVWEPLEAFLEDIKTIYIAPTGILHAISFAGINKENRYLFDDFTIHNLLSTRDIIKIKKQKTSVGSAKHIALFGGADYGLSANLLAQVDLNLERGEVNHLNRTLLDEIGPLRGQGFSYLPGSQNEVLQIEKKLAELNWKTSLFIDNEATEARFKSFSSIQSPEVIHISTHGFYFQKPHKDNAWLLATSASNVYQLSDNPLIRTGLAFAGANHVWKGGDPVDGIDDGILTAYEVSNMNLTNTELVVLSACNTGLGDINVSEGVFGLQRAFRLAGVQTMIVSLREVPDKETVELMTEFYTLWTQGIDKKNAFTLAQQKLRQIYPHQPEKWAGFIMIE